MFKAGFLTILLFLSATPVCSDDELSSLKTDVLVFGATPAGIAASISAAKGGQSVILIEPGNRIGGMVTNGLSNSDFRSFEALTGFFFDFSQRVQRHYDSSFGRGSPQSQAAFRGTHGEPKVNLQVLRSMISEHPRIKVVKLHSLDSVFCSEHLQGRQRILSARFTGENQKRLVVHAKFYIDASYEGDLLAAAGEPFHVGRESRRQYGEKLAGDSNGNGDGQVQGYNFRLIMTNLRSNQVPTPMPKNYKREDFSGVIEVFRNGRTKKVFSADRSGIFRAHFPLLPNGKADVNDTPHAAVRLSMPDINDLYPNGDAATRRQIIERHLYYNVGLLYFLQNDPDVPADIRKDANRWAFCRDEFTESDGIPPMLYVREARRMTGQHVFTGKDTRLAENDVRAVLHADSIAIGDYVHNCHGTGRTGTRYQGKHSGEFYKPIQPYQIPYGVIVPTRSENLLVPVACSASHFGFGALRLEPIWCSLGQAAGWAASLSLSGNVAAQEIKIEKLQFLLHRDRSATIYLSDVTPNAPGFAEAQWFGTRGGFHGLETSGVTKPKPRVGQYTYPFPGHDAGMEKPLVESVKQKWLKLFQMKPESIQGIKTRGDFVRKAYRSHLSSIKQ